MVSEVRFNFPTFRFPPKSFKVDDALRDYCVIQRPGTTVGSLTVILQYTETAVFCLLFRHKRQEYSPFCRSTFIINTGIMTWHVAYIIQDVKVVGYTVKCQLAT